MAELRTFKCDECPAIKKDVNGWFMYRRAPGEFHIFQWDIAMESMAHIPTGIVPGHLCSESCAAKAMSKAIGAGQ